MFERIGAFVTLTLETIDLSNRVVYQWPQLGVRSKFDKHLTTVLLDIPDLIDVVDKWDREVRSVLPEGGYWFAPISSKTRLIDPDNQTIGKYRSSRFYRDVSRWLEANDLPNFTPHQLRRGHSVYLLKRCKNIADLKTVSPNFGHSSLSVTDGIYGILSDDDVFERISSLGRRRADYDENDLDIAVQLETLAARLRSQR